MPRLRDRHKQIPFGLTYHDPATKWRARPFTSFDSIVQQLISLRRANPFLTQQNGWSMDYEVVANEVDLFNALICERQGWNDYIYSGEGEAPQPVPFPNSGTFGRNLRSVAAGGSTLVDWLKSGAEAVPKERAEQRAAVCVACPLNERGTLESFFTRMASEAIRGALNLKREYKLETTRDENLGVCAACKCPMKLKVWLKIDEIAKRLQPDARAALHPSCWIPDELKTDGRS